MADSEATIESSEGGLCQSREAGMPSDTEQGIRALSVLAVGESEFLFAAGALSTTAGDGTPGFTVHTATSLDKALAVLSSESFDAVLLELSGPEGFNSLTAMHDRYPVTPLVVCGHDDPGMAIRATRLGAEEYVPDLRPGASALTRALLVAVERADLERGLRDSESKYRTLVEQSPDGFMASVPAPGMPITEVNRRMCEITGYSEEELLRLGLHDIVLSEETQAAPFRVDEVLSGKTMLRERTIVRKDGSLVPTESATRVLPNGLVQIIVRDISQRKRAEEALRAGEERYRTLVDILPNTVILTDLDGNILFCNRLAVALHGFATLDDMLGRDASEFVVPEDRQRSIEAMRNTLEQGTIHEVELAFIKADGATYSGLLSAAVIYDRDSKPAGFVRVVRDISGRKRSEARIRQLNEALEEKVARRTAELEAANQQLRAEITERLRVEDAFRFSEQRFATAFRTSPVAMAITALDDGTVIDANDSFFNLTDYSPDEVLGFSTIARGIWTVPEEREMMVAMLQEKGSVHNFPWHLGRKSGEILDALLSVETIQLGGETCLLSLCTDVTEQKQAEEALRRSEQQFRAVFESSIDAMALLDDGGLLLDANTAASDLTGISREELLAVDIRGLLTDTSLEKARETWLTAMSKGVAYSETRIMRADGQTRDVEYNIKANVISGYHLAVLHDITERKRAQDELQVANTGLTLAMQELEAFSYSVSHDLQAPLRAISGYATALSDEFANQLTGDGPFYLARIHANTRKMSELIEDLLSFSRTARQPMNTGLIDMRELTQEVIAGLDLAAAGRDIRFQINPLPPVRGDRAMLRSVLANLIANAVKFTRPIEQAVIEVGSYSDPAVNQEVFYVKDNGVGFDETYRNKLFVVFQRLHASNEFEGTGVGLAIVLRIIQRHGGRVWADGKVGEGATFYFTLPAEPTELS